MPKVAQFVQHKQSVERGGGGANTRLHGAHEAQSLCRPELTGGSDGKGTYAPAQASKHIADRDEDTPGNSLPAYCQIFGGVRPLGPACSTPGATCLQQPIRYTATNIAHS